MGVFLNNYDKREIIEKVKAGIDIEEACFKYMFCKYQAKKSYDNYIKDFVYIPIELADERSRTLLNLSDEEYRQIKIDTSYKPDYTILCEKYKITVTDAFDILEAITYRPAQWERVKEEALKDYYKGMSYEDLAEKYYISEIQEFIDPFDEQDIFDLYEYGYSINDIYEDRLGTRFGDKKLIKKIIEKKKKEKKNGQ